MPAIFNTKGRRRFPSHGHYYLFTYLNAANMILLMDRENKEIRIDISIITAFFGSLIAHSAFMREVTD